MTGTITRTKLKSGRYSWGFVYDAGRDANGKRIQTTKQGLNTKREAEESLRQAIAEKDQGLTVQKSGKTFGEFFTSWLDQHGQAHWAKKTVHCNRQHAAYAVRMFGEVPLQKLTPQRIEQDLCTLLARGGRKTEEYPSGRPLSTKTIQEIASLVKQSLDKAVKWKRIARNPMDDVERPPVKRREVMVPEMEEFGRYLEVIQDTRYYAFSVFSAAAGCRRGEALALQRSDIDWKTGVVRFSKSLSQVAGVLEVKHTKSERTRHVRISRATLDVIAEHCSELDRERELFRADYVDNRLVFPRPDGRYYMPDRVTGRISEFMRKAGLKASLHSLRHLHASLLLSKAVPITVIRDRLGHASSQITLNIYSHVLKNDDARAIETWDEETSDLIRKTRVSNAKNPSESSDVKFCEVISVKTGTSH